MSWHCYWWCDCHTLGQDRLDLAVLHRHWEMADKSFLGKLWLWLVR